MNLKSFIEHLDTPHNELDAMLNSPSVGVVMSNLVVDEHLDTRELRRFIKRYANCAEGPFGTRRLDLYHQVQDLFQKLRGVLPGLKPYELKDSFITDDEAYLLLLTCSHERRAQETIAEEILKCSPNTVGTRRADIANGTRIAGMCVQAEFGYRGQFQSSVHPLALPLNLSEVYVLLKALKEYEVARDQADPHTAIARRLANMTYGELSDYARARLEPRFVEVGYRFTPVDPVFQEGLTEASTRVFFEKAGVRVKVTLTTGDELEGVIASTAPGERALDEHGAELLILRDEAGDVHRASWRDVATIERAE
ncbi:MAG: hypothetical protein Q4B77_05135 [Coriobacteriaceae bacterium]|nr:hypothetical protein [Coriobacteriaceae bacterium]